MTPVFSSLSILVNWYLKEPSGPVRVEGRLKSQWLYHHSIGNDLQELWDWVMSSFFIFIALTSQFRRVLDTVLWCRCRLMLLARLHTGVFLLKVVLEKEGLRRLFFVGIQNESICSLWYCLTCW